jgi:MFS family permease
LLRPDSPNLVSTYTAGRLGGNSSHASIIQEVFRIDPWFGVGARGLQTSYDNGWVEAFLVAGVFGVMCYTLALVGLFGLAKSDADGDRRRFLLSVAILSTGASFGISALTANRSSTVLWLIVALGVVAVGPGRVARPADRSTAPALAARSVRGNRRSATANRS